MPSGEDKETLKKARREFIKRPLDISRLDVYVAHGIVHLRGSISMMRGYDANLKSELEKAAHNIRLIPGIRDVIIDCDCR